MPALNKHYLVKSKGDIKRNEAIILVHGLIRSHKSMARLGKYLSMQGYDIYLYDYPSTKYFIHEHSIQFQQFIESILLENPNRKLHFITHSLGGIITREALSHLSAEQLSKCGCLIMLAPPNKGSWLAKTIIKIAPFIASLIKPSAELSSEKGAYVHQIGTPEQLKFGVIAGKFDTVTPSPTTRLDGLRDFILINTNHTFIMNHPKTRKAISVFLENGRFDAQGSITTATQP